MSDPSSTRGKRVVATFVTTTSYGSWLPGDLRGYVHEGRILPPNPSLLKHTRARMSGSPVLFTDAQILVLDHAIRHAADEFGYRLTDLSIECWHLHWIVDHGFDPVDVMVGRLKTRMRQWIRRGRIWTEGYCHRCLYDEGELATARQYIARHDGCRMTAGRRIERRADPN
jgi:hypothetical protein